MTTPDREILVDRSPGERRVAILEDNRLAELLIERDRVPPRLGAIILAQVISTQRVAGGVFVDIGDQPALLEDRANRTLNDGARIMVEVVAEACRGKSARVTSAISLHGRFLSLKPGQGGCAISRRIRARGERRRLQAAIAGLVPAELGVAVADTARGQPEPVLQNDLLSTVSRWQSLTSRALKERVPMLLCPGPGPRAMAERLYPAAPVVVGRDGRLFRERQIDGAIDEAVVRRVTVAGGSIVFDETEALVAVDVNMPDLTDVRAEQVRALARELAWQVRLRRLAGLIVVDFPRFRSHRMRTTFADELATAVASMPDSPAIHGWTRGGLLEITRIRRGPSLAETWLASEPDRRLNVETVALEALRQVIRNSDRIVHPVLVCPRDVRALLLGPMRASLDEAGERLGCRIVVEPGSDDAIGVREAMN